MKRIIIIFVALLANLIAQAQEHNFIASEGRLFWQKVYEYNVTVDELASSLHIGGKVVDVSILGDIITCVIPNTPFALKEAGLSRGMVPMYISLNDFTAFVKIQIKEGRYRVTVSDIMLIANQNTSLSNTGERMDIETYAVKRGELSNAVSKTFAPILGVWLDQTFDFNKLNTSVGGDDW